MESKDKSGQFNVMVFSLPSVEVGSILEYRLNLRYAENMVSSPTWDIQKPYFVRKAHYFFYPDILYGVQIADSHGEILSNRVYSERLGPGEHVLHDKKGTYSLDVTDIPPLPEEEFMPPLNTLRRRVEFYYCHYPTSGNSGRLKPTNGPMTSTASQAPPSAP